MDPDALSNKESGGLRRQPRRVKRLGEDIQTGREDAVQEGLWWSCEGSGVFLRPLSHVFSGGVGQVLPQKMFI